MKPSDELRNAFPRPDADFEACVRRTLDALSAQEERKVVPMKHRKLRVGMLIAAALLILSTIGVAAADARYGILDFLRGYQNGEVLPTVSQMVQTDVDQTGGSVQDSPLSLSLREAVYDGAYVHMVVEVKPGSDATLLLGPDCILSDPMQNMGVDFDGTVAEYAAQNGKTDIQNVSLGDDGEKMGRPRLINSLDYRLEADGTLVFLVNGQVSDGPAELPVDLVGVTLPVRTDGTSDESQLRRIPLSFTLTRSDAGKDSRTFSTPTAYERAGVTVERVDLQSSPMGVYAAIECAVTDEEAFAATEDGLTFRFLDESGEFIPMAPGTSGEVHPPENGRFVQLDTLQAMESLPDRITLQAFNCWTKEVYETITITQ